MPAVDARCEPEQRRQIRRLFEVFRRRMRSSGVCLFSERLQEVAQRPTPSYDYVFIDEAQDLKPIAIRFCISLCRDKGSVFLTADSNQSIYGGSLSWPKVVADLNFQGRARILRRNYRTTAEIWTAVSMLTPNAAGTDRETLDVEPVFRGPWPIVVRYADTHDLGRRLNAFLHQSLCQERAALGAAAVLCPTIKLMHKRIRLLDPLL